MTILMDKSIIGVDLGGTKVHSARIEGNQIVQDHKMSISAYASTEQVIDEIIEAINKVLNPGIAGIGIGVPGLVDMNLGIVYDLINIPAWKEVNLGDILQNRFRVPVYINNDANCFVMGEKYFGKSRSYKNIIGLILGTGMGTGLIMNGHLYEGANCGAGEFGMIPYRDHNFEYYCSGQFFVNEYQINGSELARSAENQDGKALAIFKEFGRHLGQAIKALLYAYDPEVIVLGGSVSDSYPLYKEVIFDEIKDFSYSRSLSKLHIYVSDLNLVALLGAAALFYENQNRNKVAK